MRKNKHITIFVQLTEQNTDEPTQNGKSMEVIAPQDKTEETTKPTIKRSAEGKNAFLSSDDEDIDNNHVTTASSAATDRTKKKHKRPMLVYSGMKLQWLM